MKFSSGVYESPFVPNGGDDVQKRSGAIYVSQNLGHGQEDKRSREGIASRVICQLVLYLSESHLTLISFRDAGTAPLHDKGKTGHYRARSII